MMSSKVDVLFINSGNHQAIYKDLAKDYSAIETPTWALLLAQSVRAVGYKTRIFDVNAERLSTSQAVQRFKKTNTRLLCFVVYGQNPNSGTVNMSGATVLSKAIKDEGIMPPVCFVGSHVSALPLEVLKKEPSIDLVLCNEGVYALRNLLETDTADVDMLGQIKGIGFRKNGRPMLNTPEQVVLQERMDTVLPGYAWDLLPYKKTTRPLSFAFLAC